LPKEKKKARNFTFRSRGDMHDRLSEAAARNQRSLSEEIESRLAESFQTEGINAALKGLNQELESVKLLKKENTFTIADLDDALAKFSAARASGNVRAEQVRRMEKVTASAQMVDILLGGSKLKSELLRSLAIKLAEVSEDELRIPEIGLDIWQRAIAEVQEHFAGGSK
jgi:hypothetical protein